MLLAVRLFGSCCEAEVPLNPFSLLWRYEVVGLKHLDDVACELLYITDMREVCCKCLRVVLATVEVHLQQLREVKAAQEAQDAMALLGLHEILEGVLFALELEEDVLESARLLFLFFLFFLLLGFFILYC